MGRWVTTPGTTECNMAHQLSWQPGTSGRGGEGGELSLSTGSIKIGFNCGLTTSYMDMDNNPYLGHSLSHCICQLSVDKWTHKMKCVLSWTVFWVCTVHRPKIRQKLLLTLTHYTTLHLFILWSYKDWNQTPFPIRMYHSTIFVIL